jgi:hypothetical protein
MRKAPLPGARRFAVDPAAGAVSRTAGFWQELPAFVLEEPPGQREPTPTMPLPETADEMTLDDESLVADTPRLTVVKLAADATTLHLHFDAELPRALMTDDADGNDTLKGMEAIQIYLAPQGRGDVVYRFIVGLTSAAKRDAASGLITDAMDPRFGKFDPDWTGDWAYSSKLAPAKDRWTGLVSIPFATLGVDAPPAGGFWRGNISREHVPRAGHVRRSLLSRRGASKTAADTAAFGELVFGDAPDTPSVHPLEQWRTEYYAASFEIPPEWRTLTEQLPLENWLFRADPLEQGLNANWQAAGLDTADWLPAAVPAFWAEIDDVGDFQGIGWYRATFALPETADGAVRLLFAGVDEQAWVYVNGQLAREHTEASERKPFHQLWEAPFTATVKPELLRAGARNTLAIRVHNSKANGGLWRPVLAHILTDQGDR